jgi:hypothetical protein
VTAEWVVLTREHVDAVAVVAGAADVDPDIGVRQLWNGGALQLVDAGGVVLLTLLQSRRLDVDVDARRLLGAEARGAWESTEPPLWWTEIHTAAQPPFRGTAARVVRAIATAAGGTAARRSGPDEGPGDAGGEQR